MEDSKQQNLLDQGINNLKQEEAMLILDAQNRQAKKDKDNRAKNREKFFKKKINEGQIF